MSRSRPFPRRITTIVSLSLAAAAFVGGVIFLVKASQRGGWSAAGPAMAGVGCFLIAAVAAGRPAAHVLSYPLTSLLGHVFYPRSRFTRTPPELLASLRRQVAEGRFRTVQRQLEGLLAAYPRDAALYHLRALLEARKGNAIAVVSAEAKRVLSSAEREEYDALLRAMPPVAEKARAFRSREGEA